MVTNSDKNNGIVRLIRKNNAVRIRHGKAMKIPQFTLQFMDTELFMEYWIFKLLNPLKSLSLKLLG